MNTPTPIKTFPCPRCGEASQWQNNPSRPFCSERCKLIDLGAWGSDGYRLPTQDSASHITPESDQD